MVLDSLDPIFSVAPMQSEEARGLNSIGLVLVAMEDNREHFLKAVECGVRGYVLRDASAAEVLGAIRAVAEGQAACPARYMRILFDYILGRPERRLPQNRSDQCVLSRRERQLVPLLGLGQTNKEIASRLNISEQTVKNHVHRMMRKMGASNRLEMCDMWKNQTVSRSTTLARYEISTSPKTI